MKSWTLNTLKTSQPIRPSLQNVENRPPAESRTATLPPFPLSQYMNAGHCRLVCMRAPPEHNTNRMQRMEEDKTT